MGTKKVKLLGVVGARPNFMKIAPLMAEFKKYSSVDFCLVHTGQHYDERMSGLFFKDLGLPKPDIWLGVGSGTHASQTAKVLAKFEAVLEKKKPDLVLVVGDVNSTLACALTAAKLHIPVVHIEAGLRSFDKMMPEEINRLLTDHLSDLLFVTEAVGVKNLRKEGITSNKIHLVGDVMVDALLTNKKKADKSNILENLRLKKAGYALLTIHRPSNVDNKAQLEKICMILGRIEKQIKIVFPVHPRTRKMLLKFDLLERLQGMEGVLLSEPLGYLDFVKLMSNAKMVLTDSGGIQEETTMLNVPCLTLRDTTERPITVKIGTNTLVGTDAKKIELCIKAILCGGYKTSRLTKLYDGNASKRIVRVILNNLRRR